MSKFSVWTFGCRCNQADSAAMRDSLCRRFWAESDSFRDADLIVLNTCTVTQRTDKQVRQALRRVHRENPRARLIVTGCYAERDPDSLAAIPGVGLVLGNAEKERLAELVETCGIVRAPLGRSGEYLLPPMTRTGGKTRPLVKVQDGCDARCSYCIVPRVRGPGRSARPENVLAEVRSLVARGFQEIVLTGVHLGAYGRRLPGHVRLAGLVGRIAEIPGLGRIRLSSIEPMCFDRAIVRLAAERPVIARHFHIPMQSGSDRILRRMRRPYTAARFRELLVHIQMRLPDAGLGTDVLVGFPGETDQDFAETCALVQDSPLSYLHVFPFSAREGTAAAAMADRVPPHVMKRRLGTLLEISRALNLSFRRRFLGQVLPAITLAQEEDLGASVVVTSNYIHARVPGLAAPPNRLVQVRIEEAGPDGTSARLVTAATNPTAAAADP